MPDQGIEYAWPDSPLPAAFQVTQVYGSLICPVTRPVRSRLLVIIPSSRMSAGSSCTSTSLRLGFDFASNSWISGVTGVISQPVAELSTRPLSLVPPPPEPSHAPADGRSPAVTGLADVVTLQRRRAAEIRDGDEDRFFADTPLDYQLSRARARL